MELVYLWVEDYKNIHKQGFNFSPRFNCHYDGETLSIDKNKDFVNIFPENINVTAIVGENGSGKSSIVEILEHIDSYTSELYLKYREGFIFLFSLENKQKLKLITNIDKLEENDLYEIIKVKPMQESPNSFPNAEKMIYRNKEKQALGRVSYINPNTFKNNFSILTYMAEMPYPYVDTRALQIQRGRTISLDIKDIVKILGNSLDDNFALTTFMLIPEEIHINQNDELLEKLITKIRPEILPRSNNPENGVPYEDCHDERESYTTENVLEAYFFSEIIDADLAFYLCDKNFYNPKHLIFDSDILENVYNEEEYDLNENNYSLVEFNRLLETSVFDKNNINEENINLLRKYSDFLELDFIDKLDRKFSDLSHGEKTIFGQFLSIYSILKSTNRLLLALDETDLSLHPEWQRKYIFEFSNTFFKLGSNIHLILTSHSPFILSDIPKENVIFLENGEQKYPFEDNEQTFGANIHTLLSHGFFMKDGLMGEFAKDKIQSIIKYHENIEKKEILEADKIEYKTKKQKEFWQIQSIIGDDYLKQVIKNHLIEVEKIVLGNDEAKKEEVKRLKAQIELLEK